MTFEMHLTLKRWYRNNNSSIIYNWMSNFKDKNIPSGQQIQAIHIVIEASHTTNPRVNSSLNSLFSSKASFAKFVK